MNVLVVGATGLVGLEICRRLQHTDHSTRALIRKNQVSSDYLENELLNMGTESGSDGPHTLGLVLCVLVDSPNCHVESLAGR